MAAEGELQQAPTATSTTIEALQHIDELLPVVYEEIRTLAEAILQRSQPIDSTRTTSLIQDVYIRLAKRGLKFKDRSHFLCTAAKAMRFVLVDRARYNGAAKRIYAQPEASIDQRIVPRADEADLLALDEALGKLAQFDARKSRIVELRFFGGLSVDETAEILGVSSITIKREWSVARAWLGRELGRNDSTQ